LGQEATLLDVFADDLLESEREFERFFGVPFGHDPTTKFRNEIEVIHSETKITTGAEEQQYSGGPRGGSVFLFSPP
jgi:hypothetical protein